MRKPNTSDEALRLTALRTARVQFTTATVDELVVHAERLFQWLKYGETVDPTILEAELIDKVHAIRHTEKVHLITACERVGIDPREYTAMVDRHMRRERAKKAA